ncbi:hypothetical protein N7462_003810 [Penicillium macrosclerotiorum]|uniref:uncharacterized protein n=1 Tax=Penicillium macrosclerotiorum TaxID=303699 RepID=UPI0025467390|nr:uncharacterized protein N7462_003810 [Penicillium macrosclerotiorum]KAJ5689418.1 hypothetical protein N7462_003810 [Penicillium macrosclerotiorum]
MSFVPSHGPVTLHSDASQGIHETVASPPLRSTIPAISSEKRFTSLPSHRRANTEYIARPPIFDEELHDPTSNDSLPRNRSIPTWTDTFPKKKLEARARILSDWFQGKSEPVDLGITMYPDDHADSTEMDTPRLATESSSHSRKNTASGTGRFNFFGLRRQAEQKQDPPEPADDEFLNLDISAALSLPKSDASSDEALDSLRDHATTVLQRMQEAYKQRTFAMHQALADRNEKLEELEETRARVNHLKTQLDGMAAKVLSQEKAMQAMAQELEEERRLRQREQSRSRSRAVRAIPPEDEIPSLVLQTPHRGGKRASHGTFASDSGFESGDESVADSIFSHKESVESPTSTLTAPSPNLSQVALSTPTALPTIQKNLVTVTTTPTPTRSSTYDRVMKGLASTRLGSSFVGNSHQCSNCHGVPASEAWSVMGVLKDENRGLKTRLGELELVIDDCLGLVGP